MAFDMFSPQASRSAKFDQPGAIVQGEIVEIGEPVQVKEFGSDQLAYWRDGSPKMQVKITLQTNDRDPQDPSDDGKRNLWVPESGKKGGMLAAIRDAVKASGADTIRPGGYLRMGFTGFDPESQNPQNPRKLYQAGYEAPAPAGGMFGAQDPGNRFEHPQNPPQQAQQPQQQQQAPQGQQGGFNQPPAPQQGQNPWGGNQAQQGGNYADQSQYAAGGVNPHLQQQGQGQQVQQQQQAPQALGLTPELETNVKSLIGMGIDTNTIVNSLANPAVTAAAVDALRG